VDGQTLILTIARDVSERKQAERALAESEERHRTLIENISDVVTILNPDGTIRYESPSIERSLGYRPDELVGRVGFELVHPDDLDRVLAEFAAKIGVPGDRTVIRFRFRHADGSWRVLEALATNRVDDPAVHGMVVVSRDVTGQEEMQAALRESEERFRRAFDDAAAGMALVAPDGRFVRANEALCAITGRDEAELLALTFQDITHPDDLQADLDLLEQTLAGAIDSYQMEKRYIHKQGHEVWILLTVSLIRDEAGEPLYFVSQIEDITARKHAEQEHDRLLLELADQNERLQALDRRKDEIVSVVSHDLRTPLTSIIGYLDLVLEQHPDDEEGRFLAVARRNADRLLKIVTDLLLISRAQSRRLQLDLGTVDLLRLAAETAQGLEPRASAGGVRIAVTGKPVSIVADEARLAEVLENLISNAVKFTPRDGRVEVRLGPADGGGAVLEVADTGIGIPEDEQQYLFEQFFRASTAGGQSTEGAGLGLAICKAVVDAHGGEIEVDSEPERGTTFRVLLPARPPLPA
jgi:PAS domain S-box-containing protein